MRRAFTLVEAMIAVALGAVVAATAFAGLRATSHAVSLGNRLATESALIRAGMLAAFDEVDAWRAYDDPDASGGPTRRLRQFDAASARGLPFTPFATSWPRGGGWRPDGRGGWTDDGDAENDRGWNADDPWATSAANARAWWRGNHAERLRTDLRYGRYAIFSNLSASLDVTSPVGDYGRVEVAHSWLPNQIAGLRDALGYYGMIDYLPANEIYGFYQPYSGQFPWTTFGGVSCEWVEPDYDWNGGTRQSNHGDTFSNNDGYTCHMRSLYSYDYASSYAIFPPTPTTLAWDLDTLIREHRCQKYTGYAANRDADMIPFIQHTTTDASLLAAHPTSWPEVRVSIHRSIKIRRFETLCRVSWRSAQSGEIAELAFSVFGTSLRGARQDRGLDGP